MNAQEFGQLVLKDIKDAIETRFSALRAEFDALGKSLRDNVPPTGERGEQGPQGEKGIAGERGEQGPQGEKGIAGERGEQGPQGEKGEKGDPGPKGEKGDAGPKGEKGASGEQGLRGEKGADGERGADGKDALQIEFEPTIDESKSYSRGTWASFKGGLWRAFENTHAMRGWECVVEGVDKIDITQDGERGVKTVVVSSSGRIVEKSVSFPMMIYKGVHREGFEYSKGDSVTRQGSVWHCNAEKTISKPMDGNPDWQLAVKHGRDGKDLT